MSEGLRSFFIVLKNILIYLSIGAAVAFTFYNLKKRELFGGYVGGLVVGVIGALIGGYILDYLFYDIIVRALYFLCEGAGVNIVAGFIGAYAALYIMNRLNHDRSRKKY